MRLQQTTTTTRAHTHTHHTNIELAFAHSFSIYRLSLILHSGRSTTIDLETKKKLGNTTPFSCKKASSSFSWRWRNASYSLSLYIDDAKNTSHHLFFCDRIRRRPIFNATRLPLHNHHQQPQKIPLASQSDSTAPTRPRGGKRGGVATYQFSVFSVWCLDKNRRRSTMTANPGTHWKLPCCAPRACFSFLFFFACAWVHPGSVWSCLSWRTSLAAFQEAAFSPLLLV